ncbi:MAG: SDR family NAD(P)-dependent oxidoreductase [Anaerolineales bacterium]
MPETQITPPRPLEPRKTAIIVGASSGIGAALARRLAREGYILGLVSRSADKLEALCAELNRNGASALAFPHDVRDTAATPERLQQIVAELGGLDLFVYNAGTQFPSKLDVFSAEQDIAVFEVNVLGALAWINPVAERFQRAGAGHIVGIGSIAGDRGRRALPGYAASKAALHTYLEGLRNRLTRHGVTVTTIKPGQVDTALLKNAEKVRGPISPERAADLIWNAIRKRKQTAYTPARWALIGLVIRHIPSVVMRRLNL